MRIEVADLHFTYPGEIHALRGISMVIDSGEIVAIVGQNGSGKTTLVKHFNGLLQPGNGTVRIEDWDTRDHTVAQLAARVGYVFQNPDEQLFRSSVKKEIAFGPNNLGYSPEKVQTLVENTIRLTDLVDFVDHNPYDLSPTWRKIVALASVIAMDTPIVIIDEPTTGQDALRVAQIARIVSELHARGKTLITISHDIDFCAENFDRIIALSQGEILLDGPVLEILAHDEMLRRTYVDLPQLTRLGNELGLPRTVRNQDDFLKLYCQMRDRTHLQ
ncbi:MAG: ABC transporter ATP-binding protein [Anaerolineales bacterium]